MVLLAVVAFLISLCACSTVKPKAHEGKTLDQRVNDLERQVADLSAKLAERSRAGTLEQQAKCADRAYRDFEDWGYKAKDSADFVSHYNAALDRCFVRFQNTSGGGEFTFRSLFDAFGGEQYADYAWQAKQGKKYWEVPPFVCKVTTPAGEEQDCHSDEEFKDMVRIYMGD
jgi:hypothetical protein